MEGGGGRGAHFGVAQRRYNSLAERAPDEYFAYMSHRFEETGAHPDIVRNIRRCDAAPRPLKPQRAQRKCQFGVGGGAGHSVSPGII